MQTEFSKILTRISLQENIVETPWDDLKIAFAIPLEGDADNLWAADDNHLFELPLGWKLQETDGSGASNYVAIFRVEGVVPTIEDGHIVAQIVDQFSR